MQHDLAVITKDHVADFVPEEYECVSDRRRMTVGLRSDRRTVPKDDPVEYLYADRLVCNGLYVGDQNA